MRVALTGAGGYVGTAVRRALAARGDTVVALSRRPPEKRAAHEEWIAGELSDRPALDRLVRDADAVVHAAAWVHRDTPDAASREACFAVNLRGTERLLQAIESRGSTPAFVYVGTTAVYGEVFTDRGETATPAPTTAYGESKLAAERAVLEAVSLRVVRAVLLRPAMIYGPGAPGNIARLAAFARRGIAPLVAGGNNRKSMVHGDDLAATIVRAIERTEASNGSIFNVASEPAPTMREVGDALAAAFGRSMRWIPVPAPIWSAGSALASLPSQFSGGRRRDFGRTMQVYASTTTVRAQAVLSALGVSFRDVVAGLRESAREH